MELIFDGLTIVCQKGAEIRKERWKDGRKNGRKRRKLAGNTHDIS